MADSRLRLRAITHIDGAREFKLCKKYESSDLASIPIVNVYLSAREYKLLSALPGKPLRKRRYRVEWRELTFGVDIFEQALAGLTLCEIEAGSPDAILSVALPPWAAQEVTADPFFTGGNLAHVTAEGLKIRLSILAKNHVLPAIR